MLTRTGDLAQSTYTTQLLLDAQTRSRGTQAWTIAEIAKPSTSAHQTS